MKKTYVELVKAQVPQDLITEGPLTLDVVMEVAAQSDRSSRLPDPHYDNQPDPHKVTFGKGQRSALRVLLRALDKWRP